MFDAPRKNQFTQGTIFSCAYAENYQNTAVYGLVITARCDAAQDKVPIYNFVPVISLTDWIMCDGAELVLRRVAQETTNSQRTILTQAGLSDSLLNTKSIQEIVEYQLQPKCASDKKFESKVKTFQANDELLSSIDRALAASERQSIKVLLSRSMKHVDSVIKELAHNKILGHYLLRQMPSLYESSGQDYVALLREIHHIPNTLVKRITTGITKEDWRDESAQSSHFRCPNFCQDDDYCVPVARLKSPWIEHLMQSLTMLFARIGVEDIDHLSVKKSLASLGLEA